MSQPPQLISFALIVMTKTRGAGAPDSSAVERGHLTGEAALRDGTHVIGCISSAAPTHISSAITHEFYICA